MDSTTQATIDKIRTQIRTLEEQIEKKKEAVNLLCEMEGEPAMYNDIKSATTAVSMTAFRSDQFFGKALATAVKEILEQRAARNLGAISLNELFDTLKAGGFEFDNSNDQIAKRNVAITLSKNTAAFMKVPSNGHIGLAEWYPNAKKKKEKPAGTNGKPDEPHEQESAPAAGTEQLV